MGKKDTKAEIGKPTTDADASHGADAPSATGEVGAAPSEGLTARGNPPEEKAPDAGGSLGDTFANAAGANAGGPPAPAPQEEKRSFLVKIGPILHNGLLHLEGATIQLLKAEALRLGEAFLEELL